MIYNLKNESIEGYNESENYSFPKYTSQLINWANQNAQGTRPRVVGQMSELFPEFVNSTHHVAIEYWKRFYVMKHPEAFEEVSNGIVKASGAVPLSAVRPLADAIPENLYLMIRTDADEKYTELFSVLTGK